MAVSGAGPVGLFAILSAKPMGAQRIIAIDNVVERLAMAQQLGGSPLNFDTVNVVEALNELTNGKGPDKCIDAVGLEAHATASLAIPSMTGSSRRSCWNRIAHMCCEK